jgi:predicted N-acetyltransferase YhbS
VIIRQENPSDFIATEQLVRDAFLNLYGPGAKEPFLVHQIRKDDSFISELSLVAESDGKLVGQVMGQRASIVTDEGVSHEVLALAPLSVSPSVQRTGIGAALIEEFARLGTQMGFRVIVVAGEPDYYGRRGFTPADVRDIHLDGYYLTGLQVRELRPGALDGISGQYHDALLPIMDDEAQAAFDAVNPKGPDVTAEDEAFWASEELRYADAFRPARAWADEIPDLGA